MEKSSNHNNNKFSVSEVGALIESLRAEIRPVLEAIPDMQKKLENIFEQVGINTEKIGENRDLINQVLEELKLKADRKDFEILQKKVISITD